MNEDLSDIIEQALQYASLLPVTESPVTVETTAQEPELSFSLIREHSDVLQLSKVGFAFVNNHVADPSNSPFQERPGSEGLELDSVEFTETFLSDVSNVEQNDLFRHLGYVEVDTESQSRHSNDVASTVSDDSHLAQLSPTITDVHPDSTSDILNDIPGIADACNRLEINVKECLTPVTSSMKYKNDDLKPKVKRRRRREKNTGPPPDPILPPCSICEEKSSGYHYGANTCEACKGFYRRTLKKKEVDYKCRCTPEDKEAWKRGPYKNGCPSCRYERCLAVGMSKNAIKIGRYTLNHRTKNINTVKTMEAVDDLITALTQTVSDISSPSTSSSTNENKSALDFMEFSPPTPSSLDDKPEVTDPNTCTPPPSLQKSTLTLKEIDSLVKIVTEAHTSLQIDDRINMPTETIRQKQDEYLEKYRLQRELFGTMRQLTKDEFTEFYNATGMDIDGRLKRADVAFRYFEEKVALVVAFAKAIPEFKTLGVDDQANLIKASRVETSLICTYKNRVRNYDVEKQVITTPWGQNAHVDEVGMFVPRDMMIAIFDISKQMCALNLSIHEESVLRALLLVFSDRCNLDEPEKVEAIQEKLISCLTHLLNLRPDGSGTTLYKIFNVLTNLRNISNTSLNFQKNFLLDWPMLPISNYHLLREFLA